MARVSVQDVADYLGREFDHAQRTAASPIIDGLADELEGYLRRPIEVRSFTETIADTKIVLSAGRALLWFANTPVVAVSSLTHAGTALEGVDEFTVDSYGIVLSGFWPAALTPSDFVVTYTAGLDPATTPDITNKLKRAAAREIAKVVLDDNIGVKSTSVEGHSVSYDGDGWLDAELRSMRRYKRRLAV